MKVFSSKIKRLLRRNNRSPIVEPLSQVLGILRSVGMTPQTVVDIGANTGGWTRRCQKIFPNASYLLFEPQINLHERISERTQSENTQMFPYGVGKESGCFTFTLHDDPGSRSFAFDTAHEGWGNFETTTIEVVALDSFLSEKGLPRPDILKVDAEGWDIDVLEGSQEVLKHAQVVFVEASVCASGFENNLLKVLQYMDDQGFALFDFSDLNRPFGNKLLWLVEAAFVSKTSPLASSLLRYQPPAYQDWANTE